MDDVWKMSYRQDFSCLVSWLERNTLTLVFSFVHLVARYLFIHCSCVHDPISYEFMSASTGP